jgi:uncharacterized protein
MREKAGGKTEAMPWARRWVAGHRYLSALCLTLTALALWAAPGIELDFSPDRLFASEDPDYLYYQKHVAPVFGADDKMCIIAIEGELSSQETKSLITSLVSKLSTFSFVKEVLSPLDMLIPQGGALDLVSFAQLEALPKADLKKVAEHPLYRSFLVSPDASTFAVYARLQPTWERMKDQDVAVQKIRTLLGEQRGKYPNHTFSLAGVPASQERIVTTLVQEQTFFIPLVFILLTVFLYLIFRDLRGVFIPFIVTAVAAIWCIGWMALLGHTINIVNNSIIILLVVIGVADSMHIFSRYREECARLNEENESRNREAITACISSMAIPCFLTTTTTAIGFLAAISAKMEVIQVFGIEAACGVLGAYVATMCLTPTLLILFPSPILASPREFPPWLRANRWLELILIRAIARPRLVLAIGAMLFGVSLIGAQQLGVNQYLVAELPAEDPTVGATRIIESKFSGVLPFAILFEGKPERLKDPDVLRMMSRLSEEIEREAIAPHTISTADLYMSLWAALNPDTADPIHQWSDAQVKQVEILLDTLPDSYRRGFDRFFMSKDATMVRLVGFAPDVGSARFLQFQKRLERFIASHPLADVRVTLTGGQVYASSVFASIFTDLTWSLVCAFFAIFLFVALLFRSIPVALLAVAPNALPILFTLAMMAVVGLDLRISTIVVFPMALGIAVDACIHLIARWREEMQGCKQTGMVESRKTTRVALERAFLTSGQPVLFSILIFLFGLSVLAFSRFGALQEFGFLASVTLVTALLVDLVLLPAAISLLKSK